RLGYSGSLDSSWNDLRVGAEDAMREAWGIVQSTRVMLARSQRPRGFNASRTGQYRLLTHTTAAVPYNATVAIRSVIAASKFPRESRALALRVFSARTPCASL